MKSYKPSILILVFLIIAAAGVLLAFRAGGKGTADLVKENEAFAAEYFKLASTLQADTGRLRQLWEEGSKRCATRGQELRFNGFNIPECLAKQQPGQAGR